ncbi:Origin recognition complex, subunit 1 [Borealophlyctis nickersoniae]|nr:Origin recognition complex, subunit 1 [Borealophlyctis nickersoniae]
MSSRNRNSASKSRRSWVKELGDDDDEDSSSDFEFLGSPTNKSVEDLLPNQLVPTLEHAPPTPTRRLTRKLKKEKNISNTTHYGGFRIGKEEYHVGSCIYVEGDDPEGPYPAVLMDCWLDEKGNNRLKARWLHRSSRVIKGLKNSQRRGMKVTLEEDKHELFYSNDFDDMPADFVCGRFELLPYSEFQKRFPDGGSISPRNNKTQKKRKGRASAAGPADNFFYCRRCWDDKSGKMLDGFIWEDFLERRDFKCEEDIREEGKAHAKKTPVNRSHQSAAKRRAIKGKGKAKQSSGEEDNDNSGDEDFKPGETDEEHSEEERSAEEHSDSDFFAEANSECPGTPRKRKKATAAATTPRKRRARDIATTPTKNPTPRGRTPSTPTSRRNMPGTPTGTPRTKRKMRLVDLTLPPRLDLRAGAATDFDKARERLHVSAVPDTLPCREEEFGEVYGHLASAIDEGTGCCIYISGVPGTGKTATVHAVIRALTANAEAEELAPFQFVEINGMKLTDPSQSYSLLWESLTGSKVSAAHAADLLAKRFSTPSPGRQPIVVLMDELDLLVTKKQTVIYNFFEWPNLPHSRLIVIAVANTMDLPERMLSNKVSRLTRINFEAYKHTQLIKIVHSRLEGIEAFDDDAIEFCARKVGAVSGDARRALDICRRAVEILETTQNESTPAGTMTPNSAREAQSLVTMSVIDRAIKEMFNSVTVQALQRASFHQRLFMMAVVRVVKRTGKAEVEFGDVSMEHLRLARSGNLSLIPNASDLVALCAQLSTVRLLMTEQSRAGDPKQRMRLNVSEGDVLTAAKNGPDDYIRALAGL